MLNRTPAPDRAPSTFITELPQTAASQQVVITDPRPLVAPAAPPGVYLPAIKDFAVTVLPVPVAAAIGGALTAVAGMHAWDVLPAMLVCATVLGIPGSVLMSRCLRNRQTDAAAWPRPQSAPPPAEQPQTPA